jgi:hypothetical protein
LELDELCSDVSQQSAHQHDADMRLIRTYPELFPNFYLIPTLFLNRECILELREFSLIGIECFRWLLSAIDQTGDIVDFFFEWREYRLRSQPSLRGFGLRQYYRQNFRGELLAFVREHPISQSSVVKALLDYETRTLDVFAAVSDHSAAGTQVPSDLSLNWNDIVISSRDVHVITLPFDIEALVAGLKVAAVAPLQSEAHFYVTQEEIPGISRLHEVSDWMACAIRYCKLPRTLAEVLQHLAQEITDIDENRRQDTLLQLLRAAQQKGFLRILRKEDPGAEHSHAKTSTAMSQPAY